MWRERALTPDDLSDCRALSDEAGWNQADEDWRFILRHGIGRGLADDDRIFATAAVLPYGGRFAWVCMVLVAEDRRRRGHATHLMRWATDLATEHGLVAGLDATPAGREVYRQMGYRDVYPLTRLESLGTCLARNEDTRDKHIRPLFEADLAEVAAFDVSRFGADRSALIAALRARTPQAAFLARSGGAVSGFALARPGCRATQIGPVVATDETTAVGLFGACLGALSGPVFCDVPDHHERLCAFLTAQGMRNQRSFMRMLLGRDTPIDQPSGIFALTGPEFG